MEVNNAFKMESSDPSELTSDKGQYMVPDMVSLFCDPCSEDGNHLQAEGYCVDCEHYLCNICFQHHLRPKPYRNHLILDKKEMPLVKPDKMYKEECTDKCGTHKDEFLNYFCENHEVLGCTVCMTQRHRACKVGFIPNLSDDLFESLEYQTFKADVESLTNTIKTIKDAVTRNFNDIKQYAVKAMGDVRTFRKEVDSVFDQLEINISEKILQIQMEDQERIQSISEQCDTLSEKIEEVHNAIDDKKRKNQKCRLFIDMKQLHITIDVHKATVNTLGMENKVKENIFIPSSVVSDLIQDSSQQFGSLIPINVIPVSMDTDPNETSSIQGIATLSIGRIAVTDTENKSVKIIDIKQGIMMMLNTMSLLTYGLTAISDNEIAVTQGGNIDIYSAGDQVTFKKTITNAGLACALVYTNNKFIGCTSSAPYTLRMVNMKGAVVRAYPTDIDGEKLFKYPWYMAINKDHKLIYVSDPGTKTVTCLLIKGQVKARYKHKSMWDPRGVAVSDDGLVYVNDSHINNIHILTADLKEKGLIDCKPYGIKEPEGLAYCRRERKLYVGMLHRKELVVLNI